VCGAVGVGVHRGRQVILAIYWVAHHELLVQCNGVCLRRYPSASFLLLS
jgi:hypothetical protein